MALKHSLLGLLILQPRTGYDLHKRIEQAPFLLESATLRRVYPTLKRMTEAGLVLFEVEPQEGKPDRKVYSVTPAGEAEFLAWLREPVPHDDYSLQSTLAKFFFYGLLDKETLLARLDDALAARQAWFQTLQALTPIDPPRGPYSDIVDSQRVTVIWHMLLDYGQALTETQINWLQDVVKQVKDEF